MKNSIFYFFIVLILCLSSCASKKDILYLQDIGEYNKINDTTYNDVRIQKNDLLSIIVSSTDQKSAVPFNLPVVASSSSSAGTTVNTRQEIQTYLVSEEGTINFPILGEFFVFNKTKQEVINELKLELVKYIKEPIVTLRITNFSISVLGEVNNPGSFNVNNERITIFQALSLAGDMTVYGKRKEVMVIREDDGKKTYGTLDFTSKDILLSPFYFLKQNDVIVVPPNNAQVQASAFNRNSTVYTSIVTAFVALAGLLVSLNIFE